MYLAGWQAFGVLETPLGMRAPATLGVSTVLMHHLDHAGKALVGDGAIGRGSRTPGRNNRFLKT